MVVSRDDAFLMFEKWRGEKRLLLVVSVQSEGQGIDARFHSFISDVLPSSERLLALAECSDGGTTEISIGLSGACFEYDDHRVMQQIGIDDYVSLLKVDFPSGVCALFLETERAAE